jgi:proline iminopeptidase
MKKKNRITYSTVFALLILLSIFNSSLLSMTGIAKSAQIKSGEFTATIDGLKLWYKVSGHGPVCIHPTPGWGPSSELYFLTLKPLEQMFTMVYLDTRGCGRSERPALTEFAMKNFVDDLEGLRKHLRIKSMWLMGHSDGGPMVLNYAYAYRKHVDGLILVDAPAGNTSRSNERIERMQLRKNEPWFDEAFAAFQKMPKTQQEFDANMNAIMPFFFFSLDNLEKNREVLKKISLSFYAQRGRGQSDQSSADLAAFLPSLKVPVFIIVGNDDFICSPTAARYLHNEIPHSKLLIIDSAGHFPWMEQPKQFYDGIRTFLSTLN